MDPCSACILLAGNSCELFDCGAPKAEADEDARRVWAAALTVAALLLLLEASVSLELAAPQLVAPTMLLGARTIRDQPDLCCLRNLCLIRGDGVDVVNSWVVQPVLEEVVTALAERDVQLSLLPLGLAA